MTTGTPAARCCTGAASKLSCQDCCSWARAAAAAASAASLTCKRIRCYQQLLCTLLALQMIGTACCWEDAEQWAQEGGAAGIGLTGHTCAGSLELAGGGAAGCTAAGAAAAWLADPEPSAWSKAGRWKPVTKAGTGDAAAAALGAGCVTGGGGLGLCTHDQQVNPKADVCWSTVQLRGVPL